MPKLTDISYHSSLDPEPKRIVIAQRGALELNAVAPSPESIAREFLTGIALEGIPSLRGPTGDMSSDEDFEHRSTTDVPSEAGNRSSQLVSFQQTHRQIPIYGACPTVELDALDPVAVSGRAADKPDLSPAPKLTREEAVTIAAQGAPAVPPEGVELVFYNDQTHWHLAYCVTGICVPRAIKAVAHGLGGSPRSDSQLREILVDANDGEILLDFSATPLIAIEPVFTSGLDEDNVLREFFTTARQDGRFEMRDTLNIATTYDAGGNDIESPRPAEPVSEPTGDWTTLRRAAISAHSNAIVVLDYFRTTFKRSGLDNNRTELVSVVGNSYKRHEAPPTWHNAVWWKGAMWYGQERRDDRLVSFATRLEIAAHEMTHGLIENTAKLKYYKESGALNESFADIFGVIIANTANLGGDSTNNWSWIIGRGLGAGGKDIRDLADPGRLGYPDHYQHLDPTSADNGGVHINSNIHNLAAYHLLQSADANGPTFKPKQVALLYYLTLLRLGPLSSFQDAFKALLFTAASLYKARGPARPIEAIRAAYGKVGIE